MTHADDDTLTLLFYGDAPDSAEVSRHLEACTACARRWAEVRETLTRLEVSVPEPAATFEADVWGRIASRLAKGNASGRLLLFRGRVPTWTKPAVAAALVVLAFLAGRLWPRRELAPPTGTAGTVGAASTGASASNGTRVLLVAVGDHLERSQILLIELSNARGPAGASGTIDITPEKTRANDLVDSNRLYRQTAARAGDPALAAVLDDLERVLLDVARGPARLTGEELDAIRRRIVAQGVLFKVRVVGHDVRQREEKERNRT